MAERENIRNRVRKLNPAILTLSDRLEAALKEQGFIGPLVELTEDMTPGEEEMAVFEGLIKEGFSPGEAEVKAKQRIELFRKVFNY